MSFSLLKLLMIRFDLENIPFESSSAFAGHLNCGLVTPPRDLDTLRGVASVRYDYGDRVVAVQVGDCFEVVEPRS